ncbi:MAG: ABC transporter permease [Planctomycetes bacterium]|nr:ABC transporter permease [Planctomycetota bacterium]
MRQMLVVYRRELGAYFKTPIAYIFVPLFVSVLALFVFKIDLFFELNRADMRNFFRYVPYFVMVFAPAITMRLWAEELRSGTAELLMTLPFHSWELVVGKFLAAWTILALTLLCTLGAAAAIAYAGDPDWAPIIGGYLGALFMGSVFIALGAFVSSFTKDQVVALLVSLVAGFFLCVVLSEYFPMWFGIRDTNFARVIEQIGVRSHYVSIERGVLSLRDFVYFATCTAFLLALNVFRVQARRY